MVGLLTFSATSVNAQAGPPPPPPAGGHGQTTNQLPEGGTAPIGSGVYLLLGLCLTYGIGRTYLEKRYSN
ncbi:MAG: hypothetical protein CVU14_06480 [Bacteroidetes bacterium HGW-Bacteroidetes-9]|nr:MAG: hypothetical protein CVU14_06480 [Bacteroidetes bacterium HGW-Bacteroidetes-9]